MNGGGITRRCVDFITETGFIDTPPEAVTPAKQAVLDDTGVTLAVRNEDLTGKCDMLIGEPPE